MTPRDPTIHVRIPPALKEALEQCAKSAGRSLNSEVVQRLLESLSLKDVGYTGNDSLELSGIELGLIGMWRDLSDEERRSVIVLLRSIAKSKEGSS